MNAQASVEVSTRNADLNRLIESGKPMVGFEQYYAPQVQMHENNEPPRLGKDVNREACQGFVDSAPDLQMTLLHEAVNGNTTFSEWRFNYTDQNGQPVVYREVSIRHWEAGQVVREQFYYSN
jgi:SnoaL-like domain